MGYVILLWHSLSLPYNLFDKLFHFGSEGGTLVLIASVSDHCYITFRFKYILGLLGING